MGCDVVRERLREGSVGAEVDPHVASCEACAALIADDARVGRALAALDPPTLDVPEMLGALQATLASERGLRAWLRRLPTWVRTASVLAAAGALVLASWTFGRRPDWADYPIERMIGAVGTFASIGLGGLVLVVRPLHEAAVPDAARRVVLASALVLPVLLAGLPAAHADHPASQVAPELVVPSVVLCFLFGSAVTLGVCAVLWLVERRSRPDEAMVVLGIVAGAVVGNLALQMHCPVTAPEHLLPGHAAIGWALAALAHSATSPPVRPPPPSRRVLGDR